MSAPIVESFRIFGLERQVRLAEGAHGPVTLRVELISAADMREYWHLKAAPGLSIAYRGHKDDVVALGCISADALASTRYDRHHGDVRGGLLHLASRAGRGKRGQVEVQYYAQTSLLAGALPGVREHCADWIVALTARPGLRLIVDNTVQP